MSRKKSSTVFQNNPQDISYFTEQHLQDLSAQKNAVVYRYAYDEPDEKQLATCAIRQVIAEIELKYKQLRQSMPDHTDDDIRAVMCGQSAKWSHFAKNYKNMFVWVTDRERQTDLHKQNLNFLLEQKECLEKGLLTESQTNAIVQSKGLKIFGKPQKPKKTSKALKISKTSKSSNQVT